jgi:hypothetical protein
MEIYLLVQYTLDMMTNLLYNFRKTNMHVCDHSVAYVFCNLWTHLDNHRPESQQWGFLFLGTVFHSSITKERKCRTLLFGIMGDKIHMWTKGVMEESQYTIHCVSHGPILHKPLYIYWKPATTSWGAKLLCRMLKYSYEFTSWSMNGLISPQLHMAAHIVILAA